MAVPSNPDFVELPLATVRALAAGGEWGGSGGGAERVHALRAAGHAGGDALADAFAVWVQEHDAVPPHELAVETFVERAGEFFARAGWGDLSMEALHDTVAAVDFDNCWEARSSAPTPVNSCHVTTGALAAFFGRFAPYTVAALEVECAATGAPRCRFLLGTADALEGVYDRLARGLAYDSAVAQLSGASASA